LKPSWTNYAYDIEKATEGCGDEVGIVTTYANGCWF